MADIEFGEGMRVGGQGDRVALLYHGDSYYEVLHKADDRLMVMGHMQQKEASAAELERQGYIAAIATKTIKANGTWMYCIDSPDGLIWFVAGRCHRPTKKKEIKI